MTHLTLFGSPELECADALSRQNMDALNAAMNAKVGESVVPVWEMGGMYSASATEYSSTNRARSGFLAVTPGKEYHAYMRAPSEYTCSFFRFNKDKEYLYGAPALLPDSGTITFGSNVAYIRMQTHRVDEEDITVDEIVRNQMSLFLRDGDIYNNFIMNTQLPVYQGILDVTMSFNDLTNNGSYIMSSTQKYELDAPDYGGGTAVLIVNVYSTIVTQTVIKYSNKRMFVRTGAINTGVWTSWVEIGNEWNRVYPKWSHGNLNATTYEPTIEQTRVHTDYIPVADKILVKINQPETEDEDYIRITVRKYKEDGSIIPATITWGTDEVFVTKNDAAYIRVTGSWNSGITIEDVYQFANYITVSRVGESNEHVAELSACNYGESDDLANDMSFLTLCAIKEKHEANKMDVTVGYLYRNNSAPYKLYYANGDPHNIKYLCDWKTFTGDNGVALSLAPMYYSFAISDEGDIVCVYRGETAGSTGDPRKYDPIVYRTGMYSDPVIITGLSVSVVHDNVTKNMKPSAWLQNHGVYCEAGNIYFGEYTRVRHEWANVWHIESPYYQSSNWSVINTYTLNPGDYQPGVSPDGNIEHIHHITRDPWSGILYLSTGDKGYEARIDYYDETDQAWKLLMSDEEKFPESERERYCRQLNFIWTKDWVYWASDAWENNAHKFFRAKRNAETNLIDTDSIEMYQLNDLRDHVPTYNTCYVKDPECIVMLDRYDYESSHTIPVELQIRYWDIKAEKMRFAGTFTEAPGNTYAMVGFRTEACSHYPTRIDDTIACGFSLYPNAIDVAGNTAPNVPKDYWGRAPSDSVNVGHVNNVTLKMVKAK